jgi:hypothetical protein
MGSFEVQVMDAQAISELKKSSRFGGIEAKKRLLRKVV